MKIVFLQYDVLQVIWPLIGDENILRNFDSPTSTWLQCIVVTVITDYVCSRVDVTQSDRRSWKSLCPPDVYVWYLSLLSLLSLSPLLFS